MNRKIVISLILACTLAPSIATAQSSAAPAMPAATPAKMSPMPTAAEAPFIAKIQHDIPARYATGYLGDIGVPLRLPMDFSAWFEVYLDNRWWAFDARNNQPRLGRILMATGRDASDVAMTTSFGQADLWSFFVVSEVEEETSIAG